MRGAQDQPVANCQNRSFETGRSCIPLITLWVCTLLKQCCVSQSWKTEIPRMIEKASKWMFAPAARLSHTRSLVQTPLEGAKISAFHVRLGIRNFLTKIWLFSKWINLVEKIGAKSTELLMRVSQELLNTVFIFITKIRMTKTASKSVAYERRYNASKLRCTKNGTLRSILLFQHYRSRRV